MAKFVGDDEYENIKVDRLKKKKKKKINININNK